MTTKSCTSSWCSWIVLKQLKFSVVYFKNICRCQHFFLYIVSLTGRLTRQLKYPLFAIILGGGAPLTHTVYKIGCRSSKTNEINSWKNSEEFSSLYERVAQLANATDL